MKMMRNVFSHARGDVIMSRTSTDRDRGRLHELRVYQIATPRLGGAHGYPLPHLVSRNYVVLIVALIQCLALKSLTKLAITMITLACETECFSLALLKEIGNVFSHVSCYHFGLLKAPGQVGLMLGFPIMGFSS